MIETTHLVITVLVLNIGYDLDLPPPPPSPQGMLPHHQDIQYIHVLLVGALNPLVGALNPLVGALNPHLSTAHLLITKHSPVGGRQNPGGSKIPTEKSTPRRRQEPRISGTEANHIKVGLQGPMVVSGSMVLS